MKSLNFYIFLFYVTSQTFVMSSPPNITNVPGSCSLKESDSGSTNIADVLFQLTVTDPEGDTFTCRISGINPSTTGFTLLHESNQYNLYLASNPGFEFDTSPQYSLTVNCTDSNSESSTGVIIINILSNTPPSISGLPTSASVSEVDTDGKKIYDVSVTDSDNFTCAMSPTGIPFYMQFASSTYSIHLGDVSSLDHSTTPSYDITITCSDNYGISSGVLQVIVSPNNAPVISGLPKTVDVSNTETAARSIHNVSVTDADTSQTITCGVTSSPSGPFSMIQNPVNSDYQVYLDANSNAAIATAGVNSFTITVTCTDSLSSTSSDLYVNVYSNDPPVIGSIPTVNLMESVTGSTAVADALLTLTVTEPDGETYSCVISSSSPTTSGFSLLEDSGQYKLYLASNPGFEYDSQDLYLLTISCSDVNSNAASGTATINILPNTPPTLNGLPTSASVAAATVTATNIYNVSVTDVESDHFSCSLGTTTPASAPFHLQYASSVYSVYLDSGAVLDQAQYIIPIQCSDNYGTSTGSLTVFVTPNTDPVITGLPVSVSVVETETASRSLHKVTVTDADLDTITCGVTSSPSGPFNIVQNISASEYVVTLDANANTQLDASAAPSHTVTVTCSDSGGGSVSADVYVTVTGNAGPAISDLPDQTYISENSATEQIIWNLTVSDPESNAYICIISVNPNTTAFALRKDDGSAVYSLYVLSNPGFNYATVQSYDVTFTCTDSPGGASGSSILTVSLIENRPPTFTNIPGTVSPSPDAMTTVTSDSIFTVTATDADRDDIYFSMGVTPTTSSFTIDTVTGEITAAIDLKYELTSNFIINVTATDNRASTSEILSLTLTNINTAPTISNLVLNTVTSVSFAENLPSGTVLQALTVYDPDITQTLTVTFDTSPASEAATFNLTSDGVLSLASSKTFNYEYQKVYTLSFYVSDTIQTVGPFFLQISVLQEGENCTFDKNVYEATVNEGGIGAGEIDLSFALTDEDDQDSHSYSFVAGLYTHLFAIDATTGIITFDVNYDVDTGGGHPSNVTIVVKCTDTFGLTGTATVSIYIADINDNAPEFTAGGYVMYSNQYQNPGDTVGTINGVDDDSGINAVIEYTGTSPTGSAYYKVAKNGRVILLSDLTFDYGTTHRFYITAVDYGTPQLTGTTYVDIVYIQTTTTSTTTPTTTLAPTDFWTTENIALIASLGALALIGLLVLLYLLLRGRGLCPSCNGPRRCKDMCRCPKRTPKRVVVTPKNPKAGEWKLWDNNDLNVKREPFVTNIVETSIPQTMKM